MPAPSPTPFSRWSRRDLLQRTAAAGGLMLAAPLLAARRVAGAEAATPVPASLPARAAPTDWTAADYWSLADSIMERIGTRWNAQRGAYGPYTDSYSTAFNATLLTVHATAALHGHEGPAREDERAVALVETLLSSPAPYRGEGSPRRDDKMFHTPGWTSSLAHPGAFQDKAIDPKVAEGLVIARRAGDTLGLSVDQRALIAARVDRVARGRFFAYPNVRLNQINWNCELYALAAEVTGEGELLRTDYRQHVERFCRGATRAQRGGTADLAGGWQFTYLPHAPSHHPYNRDSAEYANATVHFLRWHPRARAAGMTPLSGHARRVLEAWVQRILCGYWTHAGYLNWDTGLGDKRWHIGKTWALAQQGLLAIALSPEFHRHEDFAGWAKYFHDRGLETYARIAQPGPESKMAPPVLFGLPGQGDSSTWLFAARQAAQAVRAVDHGLARVRAMQPPSIYSFDPDNGRLAISTATYNTAIVPRNHRALHYGGIEPARLFDGHQRVAGTIGGRTPASFGLRVRDGGGRVLADSQSGVTEGASGRPRLEVVRRRDGRRARITQRARRHPRHPYAGTFDELQARGAWVQGPFEVRTAHTFREEELTLDWTLRLRGALRSWRWEATLPSTGRDAELVVHRRDGSARRLGTAPVALGDIDWIHVRSEDTGYIVIPGRGSRVHAWTVRPARQKSAPDPGPTLVLGRREAGPLRTARFRARVAVVADARSAAALAARLGRD